MWNLFGRYKGRKVLPSARQMNLIAAILNHVTSGTGVKMDTPIMPSTDRPWVIAIDTEWLKEFVGGGNNGNVGANKLVGTTASGAFMALASLLTSAPAKDKVLTVKKSGTVVTWEDACASNPSSTTSCASAVPGNAAVDSAAWTTGGAKGVTLRVQTRTLWSGADLYGFYRDLVFDQNGRLYSVSGETRYVIDTPVAVSLSS